MKFEFVKEVEGKVPSYGKKKFVKTGDVIELSGLLAEKAKNNPDYKFIEDEAPSPSNE